MFQAAADGEIKALWIACTNPAQSMPDQATVRRALQRAEFVVVQEAFATAATCAYADLLLPRHHLGREDWHGDQQRASHLPRAHCRARSRRSTPRLGHCGAVGAPTGGTAAARGTHAVCLHHRRCRPGRRSRVERAPRKHTRARPGHHRPVVGHARNCRPAAMAFCHRFRHWQGPPVRRRRLPYRRWPRPFCRTRMATHGRATRIALPLQPDHGPTARPVARHVPHRHAGPPVRPCGRAQRAAAPAGHGATWPEELRPGLCDEQARLHRGARDGRHHPGSVASLYRNALGQRVLERLLVRRRAAGGRECAHHLHVLPHFQTARAQARGREGAQGRTAPGRCWPWPGCPPAARWLRARRCPN